MNIFSLLISAVAQLAESALFNYLFNKYLLSTYYMLSIILDGGGYSRPQNKTLPSWNLAGDFNVFAQSFLPFVNKAWLRFSVDLKSLLCNCLYISK